MSRQFFLPIWYSLATACCVERRGRPAERRRHRLARRGNAAGADARSSVIVGGRDGPARDIAIRALAAASPLLPTPFREALILGRRAETIFRQCSRRKQLPIDSAPDPMNMLAFALVADGIMVAVGGLPWST